MRVGRAQDVLRTLPDQCVQTVVTSPPYWQLRDYGHDNQLGLEPTVQEYVTNLVDVLRQVRRVLRPDGTLWLNLGDTYAGRTDTSTKQHAGRGHRHGITAPQRSNATSTARRKSLLMIPARVAIALTDDGWILRNDIVWHKPNGMPESVTDRLSTRYEHLFLLAKNPRYKFNLDDIREPQKTRGRRHEGRSNGSRDGWPTGWSTTTRALHPLGANPGDVWSISTRPRKEAHFAMFPPDIPTRCITASTDPGDLVLDPFTGAGTTGVAALNMHRAFLGIELVTHYADLAAHNLRSAERAQTERAQTERAQADAAATGSVSTRKGAPHVR